MIAESQFEEILAALISPGFHVCKGVISAEEAASLQALTATGPSGSALFTNGAIWYHCNRTARTRHAWDCSECAIAPSYCPRRTCHDSSPMSNWRESVIG